MPTRKTSKPKPSPELIPVKVQGHPPQLYMLQQLLTHKRNTKKSTRLAGLGDILVPWFDKTIDKPNQKLEGLGEIWDQLIPPPIAQHARLIGFHRGTLTVGLTNATVRNEFEYLLRQGLLRKLQTASKGAIFKIKTSIDGSSHKGAQ